MELNTETRDNSIEEELDENVLAKLPLGIKILSIVPHGTSLWVQTVRINACLSNGTLKSYFKKGAIRERGRKMMEGTFESETAFYSYAPQNVPEPLGWGTYKSNPNHHFYICNFREMIEDLPDLIKFPLLIVKIHQASLDQSSTGKFGFHVTTHLANIPNDNTWCDTWEEWYSNAMKQMLQLEEKSRGPDPEMTAISKSLLEKVIPRLLRPLHTGGRTLKPCLVHSDLWPGNVMPDASTEEPIIFDSCAVWGHNEADLGTWRSPRYRLGKPYIREYQKHMPVSPPVEDFEDRNALYALRYNLLVSTMNKDGSLVHRQTYMSEARRLVEKYPDGFEGFEAAAGLES